MVNYAEVYLLKNASSFYKANFCKCISGMLAPPSIIIRREEGIDGNSSDVEEEYFEEFHLPNTHENAFVRHQSFRRKVQLTPINAPDAKKIEDLVRTGELHRHGSIRRRITSEHDLPKMDPQSNFREEDDEDEDDGEYDLRTGMFEKGIQEIENLLNEDENVNNNNNYTNGTITDINDISIIENNPNHPISKMKNDKNSGTTSTPKSSATCSYFTKENSNSYALGDLCVSLVDTSNDNHQRYNDDAEDLTSLSIEQTTLMKIRDCLDVAKYKDMYNLSGRLQDILTPLEMEEVLNNSDKYAEYIDQSVLEALSNSLQESINDSGISSLSKTEDSFKATDDLAIQSEIISKGIKDKVNDESGQLLERRRSIKIKRGSNQDESAIEGIFIESNTKDPNKKKIEAPSLDFDVSNNDDDFYPTSPNTTDNSTNIDHPLKYEIPTIKIIRSASMYDEDEDYLANCSSLINMPNDDESNSHDSKFLILLNKTFKKIVDKKQIIFSQNNKLLIFK